MFFIKKTIYLFFFLIIFGCTSSDFVKINSINEKNVTIETPDDKYNIIFKEYLKRKFHNLSNIKPHFVLEAEITFNSTGTLSVSGSSVLDSTRATIEYSLINKSSNLLIKSGSIKTFPALSSSSNSLYSNQRSLEHIKERLTESSANKLHILTKIVLSKLN